MGWVISATTLPATDITENQGRLQAKFNVQIYYYYYYYFWYWGEDGYPRVTPQRTWWGGPGYAYVNELITGLNPGETYHFRVKVDGRDGSHKDGGVLNFFTENPPEIWHFRAYGIAGDGHLYKGEDMEFEWPT